MVLLKQTTVTADYVNTLENKSFVIIEKPRYETVPKIDDPNEKVEKLIIKVELNDAEKSQLDYFPNFTSQKAMRTAWGFETDDWLGKNAKFDIGRQNVHGQMKNVLFVVINQ